MFKIYTAENVKKIVTRMETEYENALSALRRRINELTEENRDLSARLSLLERDRSSVADAIIAAEKTGKEIRSSADAYARERREGIYRLAERCRSLAAALAEKYPDEEDVKNFGSYISKLDEALETGGEGELDMDKILNPDKGLKLENICRELGLMDDGQE